MYQEILDKETNVKVLPKAVDIAVSLQQTQAASQLLDKWLDYRAQGPQGVGAGPGRAYPAEQQAEDDRGPGAIGHASIRSARNTPCSWAASTRRERQPDKAADMYQRALALDPKNKAVQSKLIALLTARSARAICARCCSTSTRTIPPRMRPSSCWPSSTWPRTIGTAPMCSLQGPAQPAGQPGVPGPAAPDRGQRRPGDDAFPGPGEGRPAARRQARAPGAGGPRLRQEEEQRRAARLFAEVVRQGAAPGGRQPRRRDRPRRRQELRAGGRAGRELPRRQRQGPGTSARSRSTPTPPPASPRRSCARPSAASSPWIPDGTSGYMRLAQLDWPARDTAAAIAHAREWLDKNPKDADGWRFLLPLVAKRPGQEDAYIKALEKLVAARPGQPGPLRPGAGQPVLRQGQLRGGREVPAQRRQGHARPTPRSGTAWARPR